MINFLINNSIIISTAYSLLMLAITYLCISKSDGNKKDISKILPLYIIEIIAKGFALFLLVHIIFVNAIPLFKSFSFANILPIIIQLIAITILKIADVLSGLILKVIYNTKF